jgi:hypothetical protein
MASTNTQSVEDRFDQALAALPAPFRSRVVKYYKALKQANKRGEFDACGARAGKFCESLIRFLEQRLEGSFTPFGQQVNVYSAATRLERLPIASGPEPLRVFIPRALAFLYTLRNKRGFAHVGGDLDSDPFDAATCVAVADWCMCELIRVVHSLSLEEAQELTNLLATRELPDVWSVAGRKRVLRTDLKFPDKVLLLLYADVSEALIVEDLFEWLEYSALGDFKRKVLKPLHDKRLIEWDRGTDTAIISPTGIARVEASILGR